MIGREQERKMLEDARDSEYSEFVAVYGRRRVGKTFLIRETFDYSFAFQHSGLANSGMRRQLRAFAGSLKEAGLVLKTELGDWFDAFDALKDLLRQSPDRKPRAFRKPVRFRGSSKSLSNAGSSASSRRSAGKTRVPCSS